MDSYNFKILHEKASDNDAFEDKTHENSALNIHRVINSSQSAVTIGLEGGWGSGKSTVINLLKQKLLQDERKTLVYLFDAWAHDGDPLRRIFLEGLVDHIDSDGQDTQTQAIRNEISGSKKTVVVKTKQSTSRLGGFLSLSAILVPLGAALLSAIDYDAVYFPAQGLAVHWPFCTGIFFTLAPLWVLVLWGIFSDKDPEKSAKLWILNKRWDVFESDSEESYTQNITEDGERTSIEFERFFGQIMDLSVGENKKYNRALIVIDNLDRIEPEQTLSIWSILQTFFQYRNRGGASNNTWQDKLWFLIPYDREGLSKVWKKDNQEASSDNYSSQSAPKNATAIEKDLGVSAADSFLEKCFQLIEEVPEPVLSSWVDYCENRVGESLVDWPEASRKIVIDTYKRYESSLSKSPTPRQIQAFVNKVGMLGMRWGDSVSPQAIALYALARRRRSERQLRSELLKPGLPDSYQATDDYELKAELAGILFGVNKAKGIQLLLEPEINDALRNGDPEKISELIEKQGEAFWVVWNSIRSSSLPKGHVEEYRIAVTKAFCLGVKTHVQRAKLDIDCLIAEWKSREHKWELDKHDYREALEALISVLDHQREGFVIWLGEKVSTELRNCINLIGKEEFKPDALLGLRPLMDCLQGLGRPPARLRYPSLNQQNWNVWLGTLENLDLKFPEVLPNQKVVSEMAESIDSTNAGGEVIDLIINTLAIDAQESYFPLLTTKLAAWMVSPHHSLGLNSVFDLAIQCYLASETGEQEQIIVSALTNQDCINRLNQETLDNVPALVSLFAIIHDRKILDQNLPENVKAFYTTKPSPEMIKKILTVLKKYDYFSVIWAMATSPNNIFSIETIKQSKNNEIYNDDSGAAFFDEYDWASEDEIRNITKRLIAADAFEKMKGEYLENPAGYSRCLHTLLKYGDEYGRSYIDKIIPKVSAANWKKSFGTESNLLDLMQGKGNHEFKDGVLTFGQEDLTKGTITASFWDNFSTIYNNLPDKDSVCDTLLKHYFELEKDPFSDASFREVSECVSISSIRKIDPKSIMERVEVWMSADQWERLEWLVGHDIPVPETISESMAYRLVAGLSAVEEPHAETIQKLASLYGVQLPDSALDTDEK